jgi:hypothetical protein
MRKLAKAAREFSYIADECARKLESSSYLIETRYARERNASRKSTKLTGIVHSGQVESMKRMEKRDDDLKVLHKLRPYFEREVLPVLEFAGRGVTNYQDNKIISHFE